MAGVDPTKAAASWKDKGGFEGLMANPAFTMGLAFMQASAEGKTIGQGALDNVMKAAGISSHYKKIMEDRKLPPIEATSADIAEVKDLLKTQDIAPPNWAERIIGTWFKGKNVKALYDEASESIAIELQKEVDRIQKANEGRTGERLTIDIPFKKKILKKLLAEGKFKKVGGKTVFFKGTIEAQSENPFKAQGGPVEAGQPYLVGEKGPEVVVPNANATVVSNDDSQIMSMLLSSNPQLQNVSRTRAESILRSRFPDYFA